MKRPLALMLAIVLALSLAACYRGGPDNTSNISYSSAAVGDTIQFGQYDWFVLCVQGDKALILSDRVLAGRRYHDKNKDVTWAESDMRQYLNGQFYNNTFSKAEKALIAETENINESNQWYGTAGGVDTLDKVFLLSLEDVVKYFGDSGQLADRPLFVDSDDVPINVVRIDDEYNSARVA
ncbi:MAG: DUF6273 domain-containing protein, partial [Oscillospiraceae bacterium]|nr:DUF6273 domain-containing protein [Oscillospiraceae bacterium]